MAVLICLTGSAQKKVDWLFMYYMPYDNDLSDYQDSIMQDLLVTPENVAVSVMVDDLTDSGSILYLNEDNSWRVDTKFPETVSSSAPRIFEKLLTRSMSHCDPEHVALFFLNHAGSLNEIGLDAQADSSWLQMSAVTPALQNHVDVHGKLDLIYYQVCSKSSLEALFEHVDFYESCMASQLILGAPNYYYTSLLESQTLEQIKSGEELGNAIVQFEDPLMYHGLGVMQAETIMSLRENWAILIGPGEQETIDIPLDYIKDYIYDGVVYADMASLITYLRKYEKWDRKLCRAILSDIKAIDIDFGMMPPDFANEGFCGISVCLTPEPQDLALKFYEGPKLPFKPVSTKKGR